MAKDPMAASTKVYGVNDSQDVNPVSTLDALLASVDQVRRYHEIIWKLLYYTNCPRPDIAYTVGLLARFSSNLSAEYFFRVKRLFAYHRGTSWYHLKNDGTMYMKLVALCDANHGVKPCIKSQPLDLSPTLEKPQSVGHRIRRLAWHSQPWSSRWLF